MFLLDTNVISELLNPQSAPTVKKWAADCAERGDVLYVSAITKAEMEYGVQVLQDGIKKRALAEVVSNYFDARKKLCYAFNARSASYYAKIRAAQRKVGNAMEHGDAMIAAIAIQYQLILATRNTKDFLNIENLEIVNPWQYRRKS